MPYRFYDDLGCGYDVIIDWERRLRREAPFFRGLFARHDVQSVLDTACGTGEHAWLFASWGLRVVATDISEKMLTVAKAKPGTAAYLPGTDPVNPGEMGGCPRFCRAAFGETFDLLREAFDAVTCLGNSFPHILTDDLARRTAEDFAKLTRPGGVLVIQQLNYEAMRLNRERLLGPESKLIGGRESLFLRIFDLDRNPIRFTIVRMTRTDSGWERQAWETLHRARTEPEMAELLQPAGFSQVQCFGDFEGSTFDPAASDQMLVVATR